MHLNGRPDHRMGYTIIGFTRLTPHFTLPYRQVLSAQ